jgi:hypothetical protein
VASLALAVGPAGANHDVVSSFVVFENNGQQKSEYAGDPLSGCTFCQTVQGGFLLPKKAYGKFLRWCGTDRVVVSIPAGATTGFSEPCLGGGRWQIVVRVERSETHSIDTTMTVVVQPA